jgi:hypothetical protein
MGGMYCAAVCSAPFVFDQFDSGERFFQHVALVPATVIDADVLEDRLAFATD